MSACATAGQLSQAKLLNIARNSSCENPYILKYAVADVDHLDLNGEDSKPLAPEMKADIWHAANVQALGYAAVAPVTGTPCDLEGIRVYDAALTSETSGPMRLYVKPMTVDQIKAKPNISCKPVYTQIYQPPQKLGGAGRVIQIKNGEMCEANKG